VHNKLPFKLLTLAYFFLYQEESKAGSVQSFNKVLLVCKQYKRGWGSSKFLFILFWHHNYRTLKLYSYEFVIWGSLKAVFIHFLKDKNISFLTT